MWSDRPRDARQIRSTVARVRSDEWIRRELRRVHGTAVQRSLQSRQLGLLYIPYACSVLRNGQRRNGAGQEMAVQVHACSSFVTCLSRPGAAAEFRRDLWAQPETICFA